jgi:hypothetical protein
MSPAELPQQLEVPYRHRQIGSQLWTKLTICEIRPRQFDVTLSFVISKC